MTDNTKPEAGSTHIIRYALELGLLWIDGDGRDKVREALDALNTLEAQLEAIGAGGVSGPLMGQPQAMPDLAALTERGAKAWTGVDAQALREGRWYMVTHDGVATLCEDRRDAEKEAKDADMAWPHSGPHRAVQLVEASTAGFTAADMATASAQGFRDGVASVAANAREPVYQARYQKWFWQDSSRECYEYLQNPENTCAEDWETRILYTHPPTAQAEGWRLVPVEPTLKMLFVAMNAFVAASASLGAFNAPNAAYRALLAAAPTHPTSSVVVEHG
jgi:hypothetical protein